MNKIEYKGYLIEIEQDDLDESPRDWGNVGTLVTFHKRYNLGDKHNFNSPEEVLEHMEKTNALYLPVYLIDHSSLSVNTTGFGHVDPQGWDSGQVGVIFIEKKKVLKEYNVKKITPKIKKRVLEHLEREIKTLDQYLQGDIYYYAVKKANTCASCGNVDHDVLDSCGGIYSYTEAETQAKEYVDSLEVK